MRSIYESNVCVVGGAGFLGSHLVDHLIEDRSCKVMVIDNLCTGRLEFIHKDAEFEHHDITGSEDHLVKLFELYNIEYVFNYAAMPYIPDSFERPLRVFDINAFGALKVINAAQEAKCKGILQVSSAEIYGQAGKVGKDPGETCQTDRITEQEPVIPHSTYGSAKAAIDAMVQVRWREAKTPVIAMRQFNCIGPRETHPYVVPEIISQVAKAYNPDIKLGNNSFRDFQYAGDAVRMATELLEKGKFGEVYNMGSETGIKIYDLAQKIGNLMGNTFVSIKLDPARVRPWEIWHLLSDNTKLYSVIKQRAKTSLDEALKKTINYFNLNEQTWCWEK